MIHQTSLADMAPEVQEYYLNRIKLIARYRKTRQQRGLRKSLLRQNPRCNNCGQQLQGTDPQALHYAHVSGGFLACQQCVPIVRALSAVECEVPAC